MRLFTLPGGETVPVARIPAEIVRQSREISKWYSWREYFLDEKGTWRLIDGRRLVRYVPPRDKRRYYYKPDNTGERRPLMAAKDHREKKLRPSRDNKAERARMGVTEKQSEYIDRYILTGGNDPEGMTHKQLCVDLEISEQTARNWVTKNQAFQAEAHRRVGNDISSPVNLQRLWDTLLKSAVGELPGQEGPNPVDAKAALGLMEKAGFLTPPQESELAPDLSNMGDEELMDLAVSAVVRAYPETTEEQFVERMAEGWSKFFGEFDDPVEKEE